MIWLHTALMVAGWGLTVYGGSSWLKYRDWKAGQDDTSK